MGLLRQESPDFWMGEYFFQAANQKVLITVFAGNTGPGPGHREFLKILSDRYSSLSRGLSVAIQHAIVKTFKEHSIMKPEDLWREVEIDGLDIPDLYPHPGDWGMYFHGGPLRGHGIKVSMRDWEIVGAEIL